MNLTDVWLTRRPCGCMEVSLAQGKALLVCAFHEKGVTKYLEDNGCRCYESPEYKPCGSTNMVMQTGPRCDLHGKYVH